MESSSLDVMQPLRAASALCSDGQYEQALADVSDLWASLPSSKIDVPNAYMILEYAVAILLRLGRLEEARSWAERGLAFREKRHDLGEAEFLIAKVAYEQGNLEEARQLLTTASTKSNGRILRGEDSKYRSLIRQSVGG